MVVRACIQWAGISNINNYAAMKLNKKKVGRPKSGRKAHCIRMKPTTNAALVRAAKAAGYDRLGDWLDTLPLVGAPQDVTDFGDMSPDELAQAFRIACNDAVKSLSALYEVIDHAPTVGQRGLAAFLKVNKQYHQLAPLARSVGISNK